MKTTKIAEAFFFFVDQNAYVSIPSSAVNMLAHTHTFHFTLAPLYLSSSNERKKYVRIAIRLNNFSEMLLITLQIFNLLFIRYEYEHRSGEKKIFCIM